eukprot:4405734-Amphidinium_carterae.1
MFGIKSKLTNRPKEIWASSIATVSILQQVIELVGCHLLVYLVLCGRVAIVHVWFRFVLLFDEAQEFWKSWHVLRARINTNGRAWKTSIVTVSFVENYCFQSSMECLQTFSKSVKVHTCSKS